MTFAIFRFCKDITTLCSELRKRTTFMVMRIFEVYGHDRPRPPNFPAVYMARVKRRGNGNARLTRAATRLCGALVCRFGAGIPPRP